MHLSQRYLLVGVIFVLGTVIAYFEALGIQRHLFWFYPWYDIMMHGLGGLWAGLLLSWAYLAGGARWGGHHGLRYPLAAVIIGTLVVGLLWEIFEFVVKANAGEQSVLLDTTVDLIMDATGAVLAYAFSGMRRFILRGASV